MESLKLHLLKLRYNRPKNLNPVIGYSPSCYFSFRKRKRYFEKCLFFLSIQWKSVGSNVGPFTESSTSYMTKPYLDMQPKHCDYFFFFSKWEHLSHLDMQPRYCEEHFDVFLWNKKIKKPSFRLLLVGVTFVERENPLKKKIFYY